jgi:hypothetical protein
LEKQGVSITVPEALTVAIDVNDWQDSSVQICEILQRKCTIPDYLHVKVLKQHEGFPGCKFHQ